MSDVKWTASGGPITARYAILYEEPKPRWWDRFIPAFLWERPGKIIWYGRLPESGEPPGA